MKKYNKSIFAYVRPSHNRYEHSSQLANKYGSRSSGNLKSGCRYRFQKEQQSQLGSSGIYQQIVGQMQPDYYEYLNKLIDKSKKQENKETKIDLDKKIYNKKKTIGEQFDSSKSIKTKNDNMPQNLQPFFQEKALPPYKTLNHERTKSYADILLQSKCHQQDSRKLHRATHNKLQQNKLFFSNQNSPKGKQIKNDVQTVSKYVNYKTKEKQHKTEFLLSLDNYINQLSILTENKVYENKKLQQRRTISKSNFNSTLKVSVNQSANSMFPKNKHEEYQKQVKFIRKAHLQLEKQNIKIKMKYSKLKEKNRCMAQHIRHLNNQLQQQKLQRNRIQIFLQDIQGKILSIRPQRKTIGRMQTVQQYLFSQSTQQDESMSQFQDNNRESWISKLALQRIPLSQQKRMKIGNSVPKQPNSCLHKKSKQHQIAKKLTREQLTAILAQKYMNQQDSFQSQDSRDIDIIEL